MELAIEKLIRFLNLELSKNCSNRAVIGGLEKILPTWESEAASVGLDPALVAFVIEKISTYSSLDAPNRAALIKQILTELREKGKKNPDSEKKAVKDIKQMVVKKRDEGSTGSSTRIRSRVRPILENDSAGLNAPLTVISGVGESRSKLLGELGLRTLGDLLYYFPRRYDDYSKLKPINRIAYGEELTIMAMVQSISSRKARNGKMVITEAVISDGTGFLRLIWFNNPYIEKQLRGGDQIVVSGKIDMYLGRFVMNHPSWELLEKEHLHTNRIVPVYSLTANITQKTLRSIIYQTANHWSPRIKDFLPGSIRENVGLTDLGNALKQIHFPDNEKELTAARSRLAFDEIFLLQLGVMQQKRNWRSLSANSFQLSVAMHDAFVKALPFQFTRSQEKAMDEIIGDLAAGHPMNRLLQGDVGSGKTIVAAYAICNVCLNGAQSAFMAPTSILAEQHFLTLQDLLVKRSELLGAEEIRLLIGDTSDQEKQEIYDKLQTGEIKLVIGTHALIEEPVMFKDLQLAVIDEQHRFGVEQRSLLRNKGSNPHLLVMTATPIPRSLALTLYGDLDISALEEMPIGRQPIETHVLFPTEHERAYSLIGQQVGTGFQAFIIYPLIETDDEENQTKAAVNEYERLQKEIFPSFNLALLHGKLPQSEKESIMHAFKAAKIHILVSTSVVEVGVDIPNATVMLIEGANRFGLAQLHQLRGRVGRSAEKSYCLLVPDSEDKVENERLSAMEQTNDGFKLADLDLSQRGPGEFLGERQSGFGDLRMASMTDLQLIEKARTQAAILFDADPELELPENQFIKENMKHFWKLGTGDIS